MNMTVANYTMDGISSQSSEADEDQKVIIAHKNNHPLSKELERRVGRAEFVLLKRYSPEFIMEIIGQIDNIFMWGNGVNGRECFELLKKNCVLLEGVIVSNPIEKI